jgi:undecaprenyl-diphosphatase
MEETGDAAVVLGLGVVQGITEFLPISSDGHLALFALLFTIPEASLALTVLLHVGTLLATALVFRGDLLQFARVSVQHARTPSRWLETPEGILIRNVVIASVPTAVIGLALERHVEPLSELRWFLGVGFLVSAAAVLSTRGRVAGRENLSAGAALLVGLAQGLAVLPAVSRSGLTIAAALALGLSASAAFRFSFLLSLPAVAGAALLELGDASVLSGFSALAWLAAALSFVSGYLALLLLRGLLVRGRFWLFGLYLVPLGAAMLLWDLSGAR